MFENAISLFFCFIFCTSCFALSISVRYAPLSGSEWNINWLNRTKTGLNPICKKCKSKISGEISFNNNPSFIFIESFHSNIYFDQIPLHLTIKNNQYRLLCATIHKPGHFLSIFNINDFLYLIDDLDQSTVLLSKLNSSQFIDKNDNTILKSLNVTVCLYFKMWNNFILNLRINFFMQKILSAYHFN
jgi:hypothetical protein